jgi:hypothetical protein
LAYGNLSAILYAPTKGIVQTTAPPTPRRQTMKTNRLLNGVFALAAVGLTSAVIGRYGDAFASLLRTEVLFGFAVVATLVALIILESRAGASRHAAVTGRIQRSRSAAAPATIVPMWQAEDRRAA